MSQLFEWEVIQIRPGKNDNHVGKLLGQKMVDDWSLCFLFPCRRIFWVKNFLQYVCWWCWTNTSIAIPVSRVSQEGAHCILGLNFDPKTTLLWINYIILTYYLPQYPLLKTQPQKKTLYFTINWSLFHSLDSQWLMPMSSKKKPYIINWNLLVHCIPKGNSPPQEGYWEHNEPKRLLGDMIRWELSSTMDGM